MVTPNTETPQATTEEQAAGTPPGSPPAATETATVTKAEAEAMVQQALTRKGWDNKTLTERTEAATQAEAANKSESDRLIAQRKEADDRELERVRRDEPDSFDALQKTQEISRRETAVTSREEAVEIREGAVTVGESTITRFNEAQKVSAETGVPAADLLTLSAFETPMADLAALVKNGATVSNPDGTKPAGTTTPVESPDGSLVIHLDSGQTTGGVTVTEDNIELLVQQGSVSREAYQAWLSTRNIH